jgi:hypothetical protein
MRMNIPAISMPTMEIFIGESVKRILFEDSPA